MTADDRTLLIKTRKGHEPSARALWERFAPRLRAYARAVTSSHQLADDAVQTAFCTILERPIKELRAIQSVEAWLIRITRNAAINMTRSESRRRAREGQHEPARANPAAIDNELQAALTSIDQSQAEIIKLKHAAGLTFEQIAAALDINRNTAATRYRAGIQQLRDILDARPAPTGSAP